MGGQNPFDILVHPTKKAADQEARAKEKYFTKFGNNISCNYAAVKIEWEEEL